jgi:ribose 5-phosphate isomerase A
MTIDEAKRAAAEAAVADIRSGNVLGLGTGSTMRYALEALARRLAEGSLHSIVGIPTSEQTARRSRELGIPLSTLDAHPVPDLAIDGADEIDPALNLIKGLGGALLREKIVAAAARRLVIIADWSKLVPHLGTRSPVPVEIVPFGRPVVEQRLNEHLGRASLRLGPDTSPERTDEGHWILDYRTGEILDPAALDRWLHGVPGVIDHGLFLGMTHRAIVAAPDGIRVLDAPA